MKISVGSILLCVLGAACTKILVGDCTQLLHTSHSSIGRKLSGRFLEGQDNDDDVLWTVVHGHDFDDDAIEWEMEHLQAYMVEDDQWSHRQLVSIDDKVFGLSIKIWLFLIGCVLATLAVFTNWLCCKCCRTNDDNTVDATAPVTTKNDNEDDKTASLPSIDEESLDVTKHPGWAKPVASSRDLVTVY